MKELKKKSFLLKKPLSKLGNVFGHQYFLEKKNLIQRKGEKVYRANKQYNIEEKFFHLW